MKYILKNLRLIVFLLAFSAWAQDGESVPNDKSVVYFVRAKSIGSLVNFTYFDGEKAIGKFNGRKYLRYECNPGEHLFWARAENRSFVEAELEGGKSYMIEAIPRMGGLRTAVKLVPVDPATHDLKKINKLFSKKDPETFTKAELVELQKEMEGVIERGMERYKKANEEEEEISRLEPAMSIDISAIGNGSE